MANDRGFSQVISTIIIIFIVVLIGVAIAISRANHENGQQLVNIIETEVVGENSQDAAIIPVELFLFQAGGYKLTKIDTNNLDKIELIKESAGGKYNLLTKQNNQPEVLIVLDIWQDEENGGKDLIKLNLKSGEQELIFSLPNTKIENLSRYITGALYSVDKTKIAYSTSLYDFEQGKLDKLEIWEYLIAKDIHVLLMQVNGGIMVSLETIGYDSDQEKLIFYQYIAEEPGYILGQVKFIDLATGEVDDKIFQTAIDLYFEQSEESADRIKTLGYPYISPSANYLAFIVPAEYYDGDGTGVNNQVVLYNMKSQEIKLVYENKNFNDKENAKDWQTINQLVWLDDNLYIPTVGELVSVNSTSLKDRPVYKWSIEGNDIGLYQYSLQTVGSDGLLIKRHQEDYSTWIDYDTAQEYNLPADELYDYIYISRLNN